MSRMAAPSATSPRRSPRQHRKRLLARSLEQALSRQPLLQLFECELERAQPDGLDVLDIDLIFAARLVDADRSRAR